MKVLVIIPAYNEENNIKNTVDKILELSDSNIDYIVINDGSNDKTIEVLKKNQMVYIDLPVNLGIGGAVQTGYRYALKNDYDIAIQFDGDGQHNVEYIKNLVDEIEKNGKDFVIGSRFLKNEGEFRSTVIRRVGINFLSGLIKICTGKRITDPTSGFRACNKKIIKVFADEYPTDFPEPDTIVKLLKYKKFQIEEIPVIMNKRTAGKSSIRGFKSLYYMIKVSTSIIMSALLKEEK